MKHTYILGLFLIVSLNFCVVQAQPSKVVAGYLTISRWNQYDEANIAFNNLTHIIQFSVCPVSSANPELKYNGNDSAFYNYHLSDQSFFGYAKPLIKKAHEMGVKVLLGMAGGNGLHAADLKAIFINDSLCKIFVKNIVRAMEQNGYDGFDLDYEYPESKAEGDNITKFISELHLAIQENKILNTKSAIITMAVPKFDNYGQWFDFKALSAYCEWFNVMTYAYEASFTKLGGHNCPLYPETAAIEAGRNVSVSQTMYDYFQVQRKISPDKLVMGLGFYGWRHEGQSTLYGVKNKSVSLSYADIARTYLDNKLWKYKWSDVSKVPYLVNEQTGELITYDNEASLKAKCEYVYQTNLRGVMIWELSRGFLFWKKNENVLSAQPLLGVVGNSILKKRGIK